MTIQRDLVALGMSEPESNHGARWGWWTAIVHKLVLGGAIVAFIALAPNWFYSVKTSPLDRPLLSFGDRLEAHFTAGDGANYAALAREGYKKGTLTCAFYPVWPALMRAGAWLAGGNVVWAGFLLSNLFSLAAAGLFYDWVARTHGAAAARWSLLFFLAMPGAAFFFTAYTESLFVLLVILCFRWLTAGRVWAAAGLAFLLPMTRPVGIFILAPLLWELIAQRRRAWDYFCLLLPAAGGAAYLGIMYLATGNPWEGYHAQRHFPNQPSLANLVDLAAAGKAFFNFAGFHEPTTSMLDRALFVGFVLSLPFLWRLNRTYFWYALPVGLVPALTNYWMSYTRYLVAVFPLCILLAEHVRHPGRRWVGWLTAAGLLAAQAVLLWRYLSFRWA